MVWDLVFSFKNCPNESDMHVCSHVHTDSHISMNFCEAEQFIFENQLKVTRSSTFHVLAGGPFSLCKEAVRIDRKSVGFLEEEISTVSKSPFSLAIILSRAF